MNNKKSLVVLNECMFSDKQKACLKEKFTDTVFYTDTTSEDIAIERIGQRNIIIMDQFLFSFSEKLLKACKKLQIIIVNTTAYDAIDVNLLNKYGVKLANLRDYATEDVAEVALGMIFVLNNHTHIGQKVVNGENIGFSNYTYKEKVSDIFPGHPILPFIKRKQLKNQTIGIIGLGNIGQRCVEMCNGLGMNVLGFNRSRKYVNGVAFVPLRRLFKESDIILITLAYKKMENDAIISSDLLSLAKQDALLVSVAHPNLIDISYLIDNPNKFRGIGFDYLVTDAVRDLIKIRKNNIIVTPHLGSQSVEAIENMTETIIEAAVSFAEGKPLYLIN